MITITNEQTKLSFGYNDICFIDGITVDKDTDEVHGLVVFRNVSDGMIAKSVINKIERFPVAMTFKTVESIDILIATLEEAKKNLKICK
jgi:hypothetical protein